MHKGWRPALALLAGAALPLTAPKEAAAEVEVSFVAPETFDQHR